MRAFILLTLFPAAAGLAYATSLSTENYVRYYAATDSRYSFACRNGNGVACGGQTTVLGTGWILDYHSNSQSTFGLLAGQASAYLSGLDNGVAPPTFISVGGRANYIETTTITGGTGTGTETMRFHVTGTSSNSSGNSARAQLQLIPIDAQGHFGTEQNFGVDSSGNAFIPISFTFGVAFSYEISFYSLAQIFRYESGAYAISDFSHTVVLDSIGVTDNSGSRLNDFGISAASGTVYTSSGIIPEPGTWALCLAGLTGLRFSRKL